MPKTISSADLRNHYSDVTRACRENGGSLFVTKNGKVDVVILSMEAYDELVGANALRNKILSGVEQAKKGENKSYEEVSAKARKMVG